MTDTPDDLPSPDEFRKKMAHVDQEFADARPYLSALCAEDSQALGALMAEIHRSGRAMKVLAAMAVQALDFAHLSADRLGGDVQKWLDESVMAQDTAATERDEPSLAPRDNPQGRSRRAQMPIGLFSSGERQPIGRNSGAMADPDGRTPDRHRPRLADVQLV